ncbi:hypothetical protein Tco_1437870 [Tanacetum coccineum]
MELCELSHRPEDQPPLINKVKEERIKVAINPEHPEQTVMIGSDLTEKARSKLCNLLQRSLDIFAWPNRYDGAFQDSGGSIMIKYSCNKACPKDGYPLPEIDWKVESLCGFPFKCFLDAYKGYHQIQMAEETRKRTLHNKKDKPRHILCYTKTPFRSEECRCNFSRIVSQNVPADISRPEIVEVYEDDIVRKKLPKDEVRSRRLRKHLRHSEKST